MKKYLPIVLFIGIFSGLLSLQILSDDDGVVVGDSVKIDSKSHIEGLFKKTSLVTVEGELLELPSIKAPVVILNFWASWCNNCLVELPTLQELKKKFNDREVKVITINTDNEDFQKKISSIQKKFDLALPVVSDVDGDISKDFGVQAIPASFIFKNGALIDAHTGLVDFSAKEMINTVKQAL